jgi:hypothetical protein
VNLDACEASSFFDKSTASTNNLMQVVRSMKDAQKLPSTIHDIVPAICARRTEIETARELPDDLLGDLIAA